MTPGEIKKMDQAQLKDLAAGVRETIIGTLSKNGGHLASSLGAVELTVALLRVFDPPEDKIVWDVGHQTYAWKILTDRKDRFPAIRKRGGLAPFSSPEESPYDAFVAGHAGVAMAAAEGMAAAIAKLSTNGLSADGPGLLANLDDYTLDKDVAKIRIHYSKYTG